MPFALLSYKDPMLVLVLPIMKTISKHMSIRRHVYSKEILGNI